MDTAARVWVCVEKDAWQAALLLHRDKDSAEVILEEDGWAMDSGPSSPRRRKGREREGMLDSKQSTVISLATSSLVLRNPAHLEGSDDLVKLQFLDEPNIIHNLSLRYSAGKIYTSTGPILIAVNPWRNLDIYSAGVMDMYKGQASGQLPPHVFGVADSAYRAMLREQRNQVKLVVDLTSHPTGIPRLHFSKQIRPTFLPLFPSKQPFISLTESSNLPLPIHLFKTERNPSC
jgi:hypothetical protein